MRNDPNEPDFLSHAAARKFWRHCAGEGFQISVVFAIIPFHTHGVVWGIIGLLPSWALGFFVSAWLYCYGNASYKRMVEICERHHRLVGVIKAVVWAVVATGLAWTLYKAHFD